MTARMAGLIFLAIFIVPGLDRRFAWSHVPAPAALGGDALPFGFSGACACTAAGAAMVAPPAMTTPFRNRRRCNAVDSDSVMVILPVFLSRKSLA